MGVRAGDHYVVRSNCPWKIIPIDGEMPEWMKIYPLEGNGEGILRFYAVSNPMAQIRSAEFRVIINGIEMDRHPRAVTKPVRTGTYPYRRQPDAPAERQFQRRDSDGQL